MKNSNFVAPLNNLKMETQKNIPENNSNTTEDDIVTQIKNFHNTHTQEEIMAVWNSLEKWSHVGPLAKDFIKTLN